MHNKKGRWSRSLGWNYPVKFDYKKRIKIGKGSELDFVMEGIDSALEGLQDETIRHCLIQKRKIITKYSGNCCIILNRKI